MAKTKTAISAASARLPSFVRVKGVSGLNGNKTIGAWMNKEQATLLATLLLANASDKKVTGDIYLTGRSDKTITVLRKNK